MHRFLHGIRWSFLRPVWAPFQRCLPLLALLKSCPKEGGLLSQTGDKHEDGDLLPYSGDEDGDLLPQSGDANEDGVLPPQSGDANGEGIPPSQGNELVVLCDLQPPIKGTLGNNLGIDSPKSVSVDIEHAFVFTAADTCLASLCLPMEASCLAHRHGHFIKMFEADEVIMSSLSVALTYVFDPGGLSCLHEEDLSACQPASMTSNRQSTFADHEHLLDVGGAATLMVKKHADTSVHAHIQDGQKKAPQDPAALYNCSLWLNASNCKEGTNAYFLIPLRGSNSVQWNDEDFDEDVAVLKMKTKRRMTVVWLFYLMKDLLDPG